MLVYIMVHVQLVVPRSAITSHNPWLPKKEVTFTLKLLLSSYRVERERSRYQLQVRAIDCQWRIQEKK